VFEPRSADHGDTDYGIAVHLIHGSACERATLQLSALSSQFGTRFIEYMTANRLDKNDRTPKVLAADLEAAMEQLWGRREVTFATAL
jgi:hypothetical protein